MELESNWIELESSQMELASSQEIMSSLVEVESNLTDVHSEQVEPEVAKIHCLFCEYNCCSKTDLKTHIALHISENSNGDSSVDSPNMSNDFHTDEIEEVLDVDDVLLYSICKKA